MVEPELGLFQMEIEGTLTHASKLRQPHLGYAPEVLNAIDMRLPGNEFISAMVHAVMPSIPQIHKAIIGMEPVTVNDAVQGYLPSYNGLERLPGAIRDDLGIDLSLPFQNSKNRRLPSGSSASLPPYSPGSKIRFVHLNLAREGRLTFALLCHSLSKGLQNPVHTVPAHTSQLCYFRCLKIHGKILHNKTKNPFRNVRTMTIPVNLVHKPTYSTFHVLKLS
jgi:hypothetical protein